MKKLLLLLLIACCGAVMAGYGDPTTQRVVKIDAAKSVVLAENGQAKAVIVVPPEARPTAAFAAKELQQFLNEATGAKFQIVKAAPAGAFPIIVGAGVDVSKFPRDGFVLKNDGKSIIIAGRDDEKCSPRGSRLQGDYWERATLFAVYDFLERFVGAKFVFPGEGGTAIPEHKVLKVPFMDIFERPDNISRSVSWAAGKWFDNKDVDFNKRLNNYRNRMQTAYIPNCHGLGRLGYIERFGKEHPEYFALRPNGTRSNSLAERHGGQLCWSSNVKEEIYKDAKAYLTGVSAKERGVYVNRFRTYIWDWNAVQPGYFNVMPQDGMTACQCDGCKKLAASGNPNWGSDKVWAMTVEIANRLKEEGINGYITQMAYGGHAAIPPFDIPENVLTMGAVFGPWSVARQQGWSDQLDFIRKWNKKMHHKLWIWTYACKYSGRNIHNIPCSTPEAVGRFYHDTRDLLIGSYMESGTDRSAYQFFNWYVFGKMMWNKDTDSAALLKDTYKTLYGAGADDMEKIFKKLENIWLFKICGKIIMTETGPVSVPPTDYELWNDIYSAKLLAEIDALLTSAARKADKKAQVRIDFIRKNYLDVMKEASKDFFEKQLAVNNLKREIPLVADNSVTVDGKLNDAVWAKAPVLYLSGLNGAKTEVQSLVRLVRDSKKLYVSYQMEEPDMADGYTSELPRDDNNIWTNDSVELYIGPDGSRKNYYQWMINRRADFCDMQFVCNSDGIWKGSTHWNSNTVVKTDCQEKGWNVELAVPLADLGKINEENITFNFTRSRMSKSGKRITVYHAWSPFTRRYNDIVNFGALSFKPVADKNLLKAGNFEGKRSGRYYGLVDARGNHKGGWLTSNDLIPNIELDRSIWLFEGQSLKLDNPKGDKIIRIVQYLKDLKKDCKYKLTFSVKTQMAKAGGSVFVQLNDGTNRQYPAPAIRQSLPWTTYTFEFTPGKNIIEGKPIYIRLYNYKFAGTAWFDNIRLEEVR